MLQYTCYLSDCIYLFVSWDFDQKWYKSEYGLSINCTNYYSNYNQKAPFRGMTKYCFGLHLSARVVVVGATSHFARIS